MYPIIPRYDVPITGAGHFDMLISARIRLHARSCPIDAFRPRTGSSS